MSVTAKVPPFEKGDEVVPDNLRDLRIFQNDKQKIVSQKDVDTFLSQELFTPVLDDLYKRLNLVGKKAADHIDALHTHVVKGRTIVAAEDPKLHLTWQYKNVHVKPIPICLLNYQFWKTYLTPNTPATAQPAQEWRATELSNECRTALGFLRSYSYLIQHESDFHLAKDAHLIPASTDYVQFDRFISSFRCIDDSFVAKRYHFGQLRLTRLNLAVRVFRPSSTGKKFPWNYYETYWQTGQFFQDLGAPLLFLFAAFSLILSAMQVVLGAVGNTFWPIFTRVSWGFSVATITLIVAVTVVVVTGLLGWWMRELGFGYNAYRKEKKAAKKADPS